MRPDKEVKKEFLKRAKNQPEEFYATQALKKHGYQRKECANCQRNFWTKHADQSVCGDSACQGKISIFEDNPSKQALTYTDVWYTFEQHMKKRGYTKINRYPTVARWNPTTDFTMASIAAFQPYVVSGEVQPPAKKLVIPQFSLRFGDVDNVGVTGSHLTGFVMIGQHQFVEPSEWDQNQAFDDLLTYLTEVVGLPEEEITLHEDAWAGGGNYGPCMEFFSRGVELCNQVYMLYEQTPTGEKELSLKVLDMGLGQERVAWFTQAAPTIYDATFPAVLTELRKRTGVVFDEALYKKFAPHSTLLNLDEVEDIQEAWKQVASQVGVGVDELREKIEPMKALYSVAEHARALLVALSDGALPGNAGGYYNLRVIFRRAQDFIDEHEWDLDIAQVAAWHAQELQSQFPELQENLTDVQKLLGIEYEKWNQNRKSAVPKIARAMEQLLKIKENDSLTTVLVDPEQLPSERVKSMLIDLYDSHGISPEQVRSYLNTSSADISKHHKSWFKQVSPEIKQRILSSFPDNFYKLVSERHEQAEQKTATHKQASLELAGAPPTEPLYYKSYDYVQSEAVVLKIIDHNVILDRTVFYPTGGGQLHDTGTINGQGVVDVYKQGGCVVHVLKEAPTFKERERVQLKVDVDRRIQLTQHHTAAHIINGAAKQVLGNHIWQAGAAKTPQKARLDVTHYEALSDEELAEIQDVANDVVKRDAPVLKHELKKSVAEAEFGFRLYQGGAVPGNKIRVIEIPEFDVEACGGTHVNTTGEVQLIHLRKSTKIQDGVVRVEFTAGQAAHKEVALRQELLKESMELLEVNDPQLLPSRTQELFKKWKKVKKLRKKNKDIPEEMLVLTAEPTDSADPLADAAAVVSTQEEHLPKTLERFLGEWRGD